MAALKCICVLLVGFAIGAQSATPNIQDYYLDLLGGDYGDSAATWNEPGGGSDGPATYKLAQPDHIHGPGQVVPGHTHAPPVQQQPAGPQQSPSQGVPPPRDPNEPGAGGPDENAGKSPKEVACEAITCNFEAGTMCLYESAPDAPPAFSREGRLNFAIRKEEEHDKWQAKLDELLVVPEGENEITKLIRIGKVIDHWLKEPKEPNYDNAPGPARSWVSAKQLGNTASGVLYSSEGSNFAGAYLLPGEYAIMSAPVELSEVGEVVVSFDAWDDADGIQLKVCCDDETYCGYQSEITPIFALTWQKDVQHVTCPPETTQIVFVCSNDSPNLEGACGIDKILMNHDEPQACSLRFTNGDYVPPFMARLGNAENLNPIDEEKRAELIKKVVQAGDQLMEGGDLGAVLDSAAESRRSRRWWFTSRQHR